MGARRGEPDARLCAGAVPGVRPARCRRDSPGRDRRGGGAARGGADGGRGAHGARRLVPRPATRSRLRAALHGVRRRFPVVALECAAGHPQPAAVGAAVRRAGGPARVARRRRGHAAAHHRAAGLGPRLERGCRRSRRLAAAARRAGEKLCGAARRGDRRVDRGARRERLARRLCVRHRRVPALCRRRRWPHRRGTRAADGAVSPAGRGGARRCERRALPGANAQRPRIGARGLLGDARDRRAAACGARPWPARVVGGGHGRCGIGLSE
mmetsp:Transcript_50249/g.148288  ORF Transcript_50249/g.148288 Transcript_50249/m.148288 type:complete len:269 (-) Transcript_50249:387-1193(-)